jgi:hypothetical protein
VLLSKIQTSVLTPVSLAAGPLSEGTSANHCGTDVVWPKHGGPHSETADLVACIDQVGETPDGMNVVLIHDIDVSVVVGVGDGMRCQRQDESCETDSQQSLTTRTKCSLARSPSGGRTSNLRHPPSV